MKASGSDEGVAERTATNRDQHPLKLYLLTAAAVAIGIALVLATHKARKSEEFLADLRAKGEKLTYRELTGGDSVIVSPAPQVVAKVAHALEGLSYSSSDLDISAYSKPGCKRVAWKQATVPDKRTDKTIAWEQLAGCLQQASEPLNALREMLATAPPDWERRTNYMQGPTVGFESFECARWLSAAAISDLHARNLESALRNIEALGALARAQVMDYCLVSQILRLIVGQVGLSATWQACQAEGWSDEQLERLQRAWEGIDLPEGVEHGLLGERAFGIALWEQVRRGNASQVRQLSPSLTSSPWASQALTAVAESAVWSAYKITSTDTDKLFYLDMIGGAIDEARQIRVHRRWDRRKSQAVYAAKWSHITRPPTRWRYYISRLIFPKYTDVLENAVRTETLRQLTLTAIAIKRYKLRHQSVPSDLAALTPDYLKTPTYDPMSGGPLRYRPCPNGDFLLYSIGEDGQDNGGDPRPAAGSTLGLWEGRDAVWPNAE
jgi:hypothetical protein